MMRLALRDITKHRGRSLVAVLLIAMPIIITTTFFSLFYSAFSLEEYPENAYTYARTTEQPRPDFTPAFRNTVDITANGVTLSEWVTAIDFGVAPEPGTIVLNRDSAGALGVSAGDTVEVAGITLTVAETRIPKNAVANYSDFAQLADQGDRWWASASKFEAPPGVYVKEGHSQPKYLLTYVRAFMGSWVGAAMMLSLFALIVIVTVALTAPLFTIARARNMRTQQILEQVGTLKTPLPWQGVILGAAGAVVGVLASWVLTEVSGRFLFATRPHWGWDFALLISAFALLSTMISANLQPKFRVPLWLGPAILAIGGALLFEQNVGLFIGVPLVAAGAVLSGPVLLWLLGKLSGRIAPLPRIALRDALRHHSRTGAAMASIIATIVVVGVLSVALPGLAIGSNPLADGVIAKPIVQVDSPRSFRPTLDDLAKSYGQPVDLYADEPSDSDFAPAWSDFGVYTYRAYADPNVVDMFNIPAEQREAARTKLRRGQSVSAQELGLDHAGELHPGTGPRYAGSLFPKAPNPVQQFQLHRLSQTSGMDIGAANATRSFRLVTGLMLVLAAVFILGVIALVITLTAAQSRRDREILREVGGVGRTYQVWQGVIVAVPAMLLGTAVGSAVLFLYRTSWLTGWN